LRSAIARWISTAQRTASTTLANSTSRPSPVAMLGDLRIDQFAPMRLQAGKGALLVDTHQTAVAGDIGRQNGRQPSLHPLAGQACSSR
jgi:hypothetical protein